jgi:hypothetical protein
VNQVVEDIKNKGKSWQEIKTEDKRDLQPIDHHRTEMTLEEEYE